MSWRLASAVLLLTIVLGCSRKDQPAPIAPSSEAVAIKRALHVSPEARKARADTQKGGEARPEDYYALCVAQEKAVDLGGCPDDFKAAHSDYLEAMQRVLRVARDHDKDLPTMKAWFNASQLGEKNARTPAEKAVVEAIRDANKASEKIATVARRYGVDTQDLR